jgi:MFS family permease
MSNFRKKLIFLSFLHVDFFAAVEVTAMTVAAPKIAQYFGLGENYFPWIINSYLYAIFAALSIFLIFSKKLRQKITGKQFFVEGLIYFILGSLIVFFANSAGLFFFGRVIQGIGAAMAFIGQMWTMTESYKDEISKPLFWTEVGFVLGIILGPFIGGVFTGLYAEGWKLIFAFNVLICILGGLIFGFLYERKELVTTFVLEGESKLEKSFWLVILVEVIIGIISVAGEFIISIYLQNFKNFTPLATGMVLLSASIGVIVGSGYIAQAKNKNYFRKIQNGLTGMIMAAILMGLTFHFGVILLAPVALFVVGIFFGFLGVAVFSYISQILSADILVKGTILYLIAMQLGNALGVQTENIWILAGHNFLLLVVFMVFLLQIALFASLKLRNPEKDRELSLEQLKPKS